MSERITTSQLEAVVKRINRTVNGTDQDQLWTSDETGNHATIGMYYLDGAYDGFALYRVVTDGGGVSDVFSFGHQSKRELYNAMHAFLRGLEVREEVNA
ncbi:MAG: hypothetical protein ACYC9L_05610 [Sulfuricaulis sp.]